MIKILITSGGTREYIDGVRVLTNISSGRLGAMIAEKFGNCNICDQSNLPIVYPDYDIHFVYVKGSVIPDTWIHSYMVTDVLSVYEVMEKLVPEMDIVIHPMAVSDFGFKPISTKLKSDDPEAFVESLKERIFQTPKILSQIKKWNPNCFLISFKFEDGLETDELINIGYNSLLKNNSDLVIANDKSEMKRENNHIAYFIDKNKVVQKYEGKKEISKGIFKKVNEHERNKKS